MNNSKETRSCISCRKKDNKKNLIRIVNSKQDGIKLDINQNLKGRGAYICKNQECLEKSFKTRGLSRAFKTNVSNEKYEELRGVLFDR